MTRVDRASVFALTSLPEQFNFNGGGGGGKEGVNTNLGEILGNIKDGLKEKKVWNSTRQLNAPEMAPQVGGQLFGVRIPIFNFKF